MDSNPENPPRIHNRSAPTDAILPHLTYQDVAGAVDWLTHTFGFREHYRYGPADTPQGVQMHLGHNWIMLESARGERRSPRETGFGTQYLTVFVADVQVHYAHTQAAGAKIVEELNETVYGERQYVAEDLEGHRWIFSQHVRDADPAGWGARVAGR